MQTLQVLLVWQWKKKCRVGQAMINLFLQMHLAALPYPGLPVYAQEWQPCRVARPSALMDVPPPCNELNVKHTWAFLSLVGRGIHATNAAAVRPLCQQPVNRRARGLSDVTARCVFQLVPPRTTRYEAYLHMPPLPRLETYHCGLACGALGVVRYANGFEPDDSRSLLLPPHGQVSFPRAVACGAGPIVRRDPTAPPSQPASAHPFSTV
ncbi:hypothetical protein OH77DRAFT_919812 [Trametes cingulata]|nr:hypothetical protein OH77DRAFT_919812 [Trametes cingulata]